ncbi:MPN527 family putative ECF transporter permease subunit [Mycoplasmoides pneumoniae]|uniref:ECF transporter S component n=3 Tax=Mycoplasmoides pneumoniae TaxID=2104 RepID=A0AAX0SQ52_MYCPM|nr:hypothetical protein [Mycoplasmoides pneumoniae]ADK87200.1 conserved hypothetical protein [Mycoplasmoides pneumoniae FH]ALA30687.1 membrane protein [Mycoplasmoides pneumoniae 19294]ALA31792.1 hypothetical protein F536_02985 [Mycoplasmoides pneumoniae 39443]ALA36021.1 membrane protein [Mycoplasmoides pneumoniae FH]ALA36731.1 membrane protein [Mycoplasmoides pneumoniae M1139]
MNGARIAFWPKKEQHQLFNLSFSAMMLALALIASFVSHFISIPFLSALKLTIDISSVFLIACAFFVSYSWALVITVALSLCSFIWDGNNWIGILTLTIANFAIVSFTRLYFHIFAQIKLRWLWVFSLATLSNTLLLTTLNGLLITPLYWYWFGYVPTANFVEVAKIYNKTPYFHFFLFGVPNYWVGIFALYSLFNVIKFTLVSLIGVPVMRAFQKFYWKKAQIVY